MKRVTSAVPGYDCRVECKHDNKGDHGVHCEEWWYAVVDEETNQALSLMVFSNEFPNGYAASWSWAEKPKGVSLQFHRTTELGNPCEFIEGPCATEPFGAMYTERFFEVHGVPRREQPESFWQSLEQMLRERIPE